MVKNYLKIAIRSLLKHRIYSFINILGLAIGIASSLIILLHVEDEMSYDDFHPNGDYIYKVVLERVYPDHITNYAIIPHSFSEVMVKDFPEVKNAVRLFSIGRNNPIVVRHVDSAGDEKVFEEFGLLAADSTFFDFFKFDLILGNAADVLSEPQNMVITEATAKKYFGNSDPINQTLKTDFGDFTVKGVCQNIPDNSHFEFDFLIPLKTIPFLQVENFTSFSTHLYLELNTDASPEALESKFPAMVANYAAPQIEQNLNTTYAEYTAAGNGYNYSLIPLSDIHLYPIKYQAELKQGVISMTSLSLSRLPCSLL